MATTRQRCFVIMPISKTTKEHTEDYWTKHFDSFLKPLIEECPELEAHRSQPLRGDIVRQIITDLVVCPVVVADLTDNNPNVYWELGVRQSFKHGTITIAEAGTELPFDIGAKGTLFYHPKDHLKNAEFCRLFRTAVDDCLAHPNRPDSHVLEAISGRGTLFQIFQRDETIRRLDAVIAECDANRETYNRLMSAAKQNQNYRLAKRDKRKEVEEELDFPDSRLRLLALELLIAHRYVDEESAFYKMSEEAHDWIVAMNVALGVWIVDPEWIEKQVLSQEEQWLQILNPLKERVSNARERISKML